ncbi:MAG: GDYXXLXY domain-containing protein [Planctomycetota bacterium]
MSETSPNQAASPFAPPAWPDRAFDWLKRREFHVLVLAVGLQVVVLGAMIVQRATPLVTGDTLLLRVVPVDPRDLFRGDYVILSYDFSRVPPGGIAGLPQSGRNRREWQGQTVYVSLVPEPDGRHWRADKFSTSRPTSGKYLQGTTTGYNRIECGIESYYVQEGTGRDYEQAIRSQKLSAEVAVTSDGQATLRALRIE